MKLKPLVLLALPLLLSLMTAAEGAKAADLQPEQIAQRLQRTYEKTTSMSADFRQVTSVRMSRRQKRGSGTVVIQKPGLMRWDYLAPSSQVLVSDGETVSMYFAQSNQMIVSPAKEYLQSDVTYSFFTGTGDIVRDFEVLPPEPEFAEKKNPDSHVIKMIPRKTHPQVQNIHLWIDRDSFFINRMQIEDQFGSITDLFFSDIKTGVEVPTGFFAFTPPSGTEIIKQ